MSGDDRCWKNDSIDDKSFCALAGIFSAKPVVPRQENFNPEETCICCDNSVISCPEPDGFGPAAIAISCSGTMHKSSSTTTWHLLKSDANAILHSRKELGRVAALDGNEAIHTACLDSGALDRGPL